MMSSCSKDDLKRWNSFTMTTTESLPTLLATFPFEVVRKTSHRKATRLPHSSSAN